MKRKLLTVLTLLVSIFCSTTIYAISADNPEYFDGNYSNGELVNGEVVFEEKDSSESMEIATTKERIDRYGNFTFDIGYSVLSNEFTVSKNNFQIWTNARIENPNGKDVTSKYPGHRYSIELLKKTALGWRSQGTITFQVDPDQLNISNFYGIIGNAYKIRITNVDALPAGTTVVGDGSILEYNPNIVK